MAYKLTKYGRETADDYNEFTSDSFAELPTTGVELGDRAVFKDGDALGVAVYLTSGWVKG